MWKERVKAQTGRAIIRTTMAKENMATARANRIQRMVTIAEKTKARKGKETISNPVQEATHLVA